MVYDKCVVNAESPESFTTHLSQHKRSLNHSKSSIYLLFALLI